MCSYAQQRCKGVVLRGQPSQALIFLHGLPDESGVEYYPVSRATLIGGHSVFLGWGKY
jgi:hypothetical protein